MFKKIVLSSAIFTIASMLISAKIIAADHAEFKPPRLSLSANAILRKPADELQLKIGVITIEDRAEAALQENSIKMQQVTESLEAIGLSRTEYETGHFSIKPTYTPWPKNPPPDWKQSINGYEVSNSILIRTDKLDMAGKLIDSANKAGANSISDIGFSLHDPRTYWKEALSAATANAIDDAQAIAAAAGVHLGRVLSLSLNSTNVTNQNINAKFLVNAMAADGGTTTPIEPGEVTITANVSIIYEITEN